MIIGVGIDIIEVERVKKLVEQNPRALTRVFTPQEIEYCQDKKSRYLHLAARFAAKEAFFKALGKRTSWKDVGVINHPSGKPFLKLNSKKKFDFGSAHVSLSHLSKYAVALVILEK